MTFWKYAVSSAAVVFASCTVSQGIAADAGATNVTKASESQAALLPLTGVSGAHMAINFTSVTSQAMRNSVPGPFQAGGSIAVEDMQVTVTRSAFTQANGQQASNDLAQAVLTNVRLANGSLLPKAGFWVGRTVETGARILQFRPSLDASLRDVPGFGEDLTFVLGPDGSVQIPSLNAVGGVARDFVAAVIANGPALMNAATVQVIAPAQLGKEAVGQILTNLHTSVQAAPDQYFNGLRKLNAQWIGISVAMFVPSVSDPAVRLQYRAAGDDVFKISTWDDADLSAFIARAHALGFKTYLTLAIEQPKGDVQGAVVPGDPACKRADAPIHRFLMGKPFVDSGETMMQCLSPADFWWAPEHPQHTAKRSAFWSSYTDIAVKYARLSQELGVAMYSLGTETDWLFRARATAALPVHFGTELRQMVSQVRAVYSGLLTYDQHISVLIDPSGFRGGEWAPMLVSDLGLDVIGISAYPETLRNQSRPTQVMGVAQLEQLYWKPVFDNTLVPLRARYPTLPIVFTEYGVVNDVGVPSDQQSNIGKPVTGRDANGVTDGMRQQANLHNAFFNVNERYNRLVAGAFVWANYMMDGAATANECQRVTHHIPCSPPAQAAIAAGYASVNEASMRVLNWAESALPTFLPTLGVAATVNGIGCRSYPTTGNYLCIRDGRVLAHNGREWQLLDVGAVADFLPAARAAGF